MTSWPKITAQALILAFYQADEDTKTYLESTYGAKTFKIQICVPYEADIEKYRTAFYEALNSIGTQAPAQSSSSGPAAPGKSAGKGRDDGRGGLRSQPSSGPTQPSEPTTRTERDIRSPEPRLRQGYRKIHDIEGRDEDIHYVNDDTGRAQRNAPIWNQNDLLHPPQMNMIKFVPLLTYECLEDMDLDNRVSKQHCVPEESVTNVRVAQSLDITRYNIFASVKSLSNGSIVLRKV